MPTPRDCEIFRRVVIHGERQTKVARDLGLTKQRVFSICERLRRMTFRELLDDFKGYRSTTLLRLEFVYAEAVAAWERSKGGTKSKTTTTGQADSDVVSTTRSKTHGNPRFLAEARSALAGIRELCGLNAPQKVEIRSTYDVYIDIDRLPREERLKLAELDGLVEAGVIRFVEGEGVGEGSL